MKKINELLKQYAPSIVLGVIATSLVMVVTALCTHSFYGRVLYPITGNVIIVLTNYIYTKKLVKDCTTNLTDILLSIAASVIMMLFLLLISYIK